MIDLHTHSDESDGSLSPERLVQEARRRGLEALSITDHDTVAAYPQAVPVAKAVGLDLVCGVELSVKLDRQNGSPVKGIHLLGYFLDGPPATGFTDWLGQLQQRRRARNHELVQRLQALGLQVSETEAETFGRNLTGRPHFARVLVRKGYATSVQDAFDRYLGESAPAYVPRQAPAFAKAASMLAAGGGFPVLAHPFRLARKKGVDLDALVAEMVGHGLRGIEAYYSDHTAADVERFLGLASTYGLAVTGGSDFHGEAKPGVELGTGRDGNLVVPRELLDHLRASARRRS